MLSLKSSVPLVCLNIGSGSRVLVIGETFVDIIGKRAPDWDFLTDCDIEVLRYFRDLLNSTISAFRLLAFTTGKRSSLSVLNSGFSFVSNILLDDAI